MDERTIGAHDTMSVSSCINSFNTWGFFYYDDPRGYKLVAHQFMKNLDKSKETNNYT